MNISGRDALRHVTSQTSHRNTAALSGDVGDLLAKRAAKLLPDTDDELNNIATEEYRRALFEWDNDDDRPPFTKHDIWMALMDDS
ncbi:hypothetical protein CVM73_16760 [Bradyrhizobium forestalis]|uniref:Uncharacterized protein n=1 Tax=Bradyrhizobium forestalis TaxID=1419263 RepID=A0A2M8R8D6_9BRAD|nr:hypothetical protein [Bradyrhizobium forestalis]PJG54068.1 hypothetical protein CVM73_16760 [Bradyrhizobium forestalis]